MDGHGHLPHAGCDEGKEVDDDFETNHSYGGCGHVGNYRGG